MAAALRAHAISMCIYSQWANQKLHVSIKSIPLYATRSQADNGHFARSIQGIVAHMLAAELVWFHRLNGGSKAGDVIKLGTASKSFAELSSEWGAVEPGLLRHRMQTG